jgi:hypothetical protein
VEAVPLVLPWKLLKDCFRKVGDNCYVPIGSHHRASFLPDKCCMVYFSDMTPALATFHVTGGIAAPKGIKLIPDSTL